MHQGLPQQDPTKKTKRRARETKTSARSSKKVQGIKDPIQDPTKKTPPRPFSSLCLPTTEMTRIQPVVVAVSPKQKGQQPGPQWTVLMTWD